jgi:hypothetical protein
MIKNKIHNVSFKFYHGDNLYHKSDGTPLTVIMPQFRVMADGTGMNWYLCRIGGGNASDTYSEIELSTVPIGIKGKV